MVAGGTALPSIWGADGEVAFTVAGDLSPDDLQRVARSLR
jgi:anti-sigma factor RsiW